jgi:hypothetical protein
VLDRHEGRPEHHHDLLDLGEDAIALRAAVLPERDLDLDLTDGLRRKAVVDEALEQAIPIWDPSCGHMHGFGHETSLPWIQNGANPALG